MDEYTIKKGTASFGSEKLVIRESWRGYFSNLVELLWEDGDWRQKVLLLALTSFTSYVLAFSLVVLAFSPLLVIQVVSGVFLALAAAVFVYHRLKGVSKQKSVEYESMDSVKFFEGVKGVSCPRFLIKFRKNGEKRMRYLIMPNEIIPGVEEEMEALKQEFEERDIDVSS